jgi:hypothetical protein
MARTQAREATPFFDRLCPGHDDRDYFSAPRHAPRQIIEIDDELLGRGNLAEVRDKLSILGTYVRALSPKDTAAFIKSEQALWWPIVRAVNEAK